MSHTRQNIWLTARRLIFQFPNQWMSVAVLPSVISDCHADTYLPETIPLGFHQCQLIAEKDEQIPDLTLLLAPNSD